MDRRRSSTAASTIVRRLIESACASAPLLLVIEDLHYAGSEEAARLGELAASVVAQPALLVLSTRPDEDPIDAAWRARARGCPLTTLDLAPLTDDESRELAASYPQLPETTVDGCIRPRAGPSAVPRPAAARRRRGRDGDAGARCRRSSCRASRSSGARTGRRCSRPPCSACASRARRSRRCRAAAGGTPDGLVDAGLLTLEGDEIAFAHALMREAVYGSLLKSRRRELHARGGRLVRRARPGAAGRPSRGSRRSRRRARLHRGGDGRGGIAAPRPRARVRRPRLRARARARGSLPRALPARRAADAHRAHARCDRDAARGDRPPARAADRGARAARARECAQDPRPLRRGARGARARRGGAGGPRPAGAAGADLELARQHPLPARRARGLPDGARARARVGADAPARRWTRRAPSAASATRSTSAAACRARATTSAQCVAEAREHGAVGLALSNAPMLALTRAICGEVREALEDCTAIAAEAVRFGDPRSELLTRDIEAMISLYRADYERVRLACDRGLVLARQLGARRFEAELMTLQGHAIGELGGSHGCAGAARRRSALALEVATTYCGPWCLGIQALHTPNVERARELLAQGEALLAGGCVSHNHLEFRRAAMEFGLRHERLSARPAVTRRRFATTRATSRCLERAHRRRAPSSSPTAPRIRRAPTSPRGATRWSARHPGRPISSGCCGDSERPADQRRSTSQVAPMAAERARARAARAVRTSGCGPPAAVPAAAPRSRRGSRARRRR